MISRHSQSGLLTELLLQRTLRTAKASVLTFVCFWRGPLLAAQENRVVTQPSWSMSQTEFLMSTKPLLTSPFLGQAQDIPTPSSRGDYLSAAADIGYKIVRETVWAGSRCTWFANNYEVVDGQWSYTVRPLGPFLYDGTAGVSVFLSALYAQTGEDLFCDAAIGAIRTSVYQWDLQNGQFLGMFNGGAGIAFAADLAGNHLGSEELCAIS